MDAPLHPLSIALGSEATFVARSVDTHTKHLGAVLRRAAAHRGAALVEIYQNCNVYNDGAFEYAKDVKLRSDTLVELEHGQPIVFGAKRDKGIRLNGLAPEVVPFGNGTDASDLLVHDETAAEPTLATVLARMRHPALPEAIGGAPRGSSARPSTRSSTSRWKRRAPGEGKGELADLLRAGDTWTVG